MNTQTRPRLNATGPARGTWMVGPAHSYSPSAEYAGERRPRTLARPYPSAGAPAAFRQSPDRHGRAPGMTRHSGIATSFDLSPGVVEHLL